MRRTICAALAILALLVAVGPTHATCTAANPSANVVETTPTSAFVVNANATVTHNLTGLMWKQCPEGRSGADCLTGGSNTMNWANALAAANTANAAQFAGYNDWRLPNKKELDSIVEFCGYSPAINRTVFPNTPALPFWSASSYFSDFNRAWFVIFVNGADGANNKGDPFAVRLVRGGQPDDSFDGFGSTYNVANDFSITSNPNGTWQYGYKLTGSSAFQLFNTGVNNAFSVTGLQHWYASSLASEPHAIYNSTNSTVHFRTTVTLGAKSFQLHPAPNGQQAVARWIAPATDIYQVDAAFRGNDSTSTLVYVQKNGVNVFSGAVSGFGAGPMFSSSIALSANDTIDFVVDANGLHQNDSTGLAVTIAKSSTGSLTGTITPTSARLDVPQTFTVTGSGFTGSTTFAVTDCENDATYVPAPANTSSQASFRCTPRFPGPASLQINNVAVAGQSVFVDHPTRQGDPSARGIPGVKGVSTWNGNYQHSVVDMEVPGVGLSFTLARSYNSYDWGYEKERGGVGNYRPWRFNWEVSIGFIAGNTSQLYFQREDGSGETFFKDTSVWYPMDQSNFDQVQENIPDSLHTTILTRSGLKYVFENAIPASGVGGRLVGIYDHDGNGLTVTRDANGRVGVVTDASGRTYTFEYHEPSTRLKKVTDFANRAVSYTWETDTPAEAPTQTREVIKTVTDVRSTVATPIVTIYNYQLLTGSAGPQKKLLTSIVDPRGNTAVRLAYDSNVYGNWGVSTFMDVLDNTWTFTYCAKKADNTCASQVDQAQSFQTSVATPLTGTPNGGSALLYEFDNGGRLKASTNASGARSSVATVDSSTLTAKTYNTAALVKQRKSPLGVAGSYGTAYTHTPDNQGNLASQTDAEGVSRQHTWTTPASLLALNLHARTQTSIATQTLAGAPATATHAFAYSETTGKGKLASHTPPGLPSTNLSYFPAGLLQKHVDARLNETSFLYDTHGFMTQSTLPGAVVVTRTATPDNLCREATRMDPRGQGAANPAAYTTTTTYDLAGNVLTVAAPKSGTVTYTYDANGNRSSMVDGRGNLTEYSYTPRNELWKTTAHVTLNGVLSNVVTENTYDALGRLISVKNPNLHATTTVPNANGKPLSQADALGNTRRYSYDADDRVLTETDPDNRVTAYEYDKVGRVTKVTRGFGTAAASSQTTTYYPDGRMKTATDPDGKVTKYEYDLAGRLVKVTDANNVATTAGYDDNGNQTSVTDPNGHVTLFTYDALNRLKRIVDPANPSVQYWETLYDKNGNVVETSAPGPVGGARLVTTREVDEANRLKKITFPDSTTVTYDYDNNGNRTSMLDVTGTTAYQYDELNRLTQITDPQGKVVKYAYDGVNLKTLTYPGNQAVSYGYDAAERMTTVTDWLSKTTTYSLNKSGQVTAVAMGNTARADMIFDAAGRLTSLLNKKGDGSILSSHSLTLDKRGNITSSVVQLPLEPTLLTLNRALPVDSNNRLTSFDGSPVTHDPAGRITGLAGNTYSYDARDLITGIAGAQTASFAYNGDGHRVTRTLGGQTTRFVIGPNGDLHKVLAETDAAGTVQRRYVYGYGLLEQIDAANTPHYYHYDPTGHTLALSNGSGAVSDTYAYTPYGETTASGSTVNPFRYVGKLGVMDDGNGMLYMRARYYRPDVARFMSMDKVLGNAKEAQGLNRYAYVRGNPVMGVDPSGLLSNAEAVQWTGDQVKDKLIDWFIEKAIKEPLVDAKLVTASRFDSWLALGKSGKTVFESAVKKVAGAPAEVLQAIDVFDQLASGKNLSFTEGQLECGVDDILGQGTDGSKDACLAKYTQPTKSNKPSLVDFACDPEFEAGGRLDDGVCKGAIYVQGLGTTIVATYDAAGWVKEKVVKPIAQWEYKNVVVPVFQQGASDVAAIYNWLVR